MLQLQLLLEKHVPEPKVVRVGHKKLQMWIRLCCHQGQSSKDFCWNVKVSRVHKICVGPSGGLPGAA